MAYCATYHLQKCWQVFLLALYTRRALQTDEEENNQIAISENSYKVISPVRKRIKTYLKIYQRADELWHPVCI